MKNFIYFIALVFISFPAIILADAGDLDQTFGNNGLVTTDILTRGFYDEQCTDVVAVQTDGKIVVVGYSGSLQYHTIDYVLSRFNPDGTLDYNFGTNGTVTTDLTTDNDYANCIAIQNDGKILVAGYSYMGSTGNDFALVRYTTDGSLDNSFGTNGIVLTDFNNLHDRAYDILIQSDGKIVLGGDSNNDFALARYDENGNLDPNFGTGGKTITPLSTSLDQAFAFNIQSDGKIVAVGYANQATTLGDFALARYKTDGSLDTDFGNGGIIIENLGFDYEYARGVDISNTGQIVVAGYVGTGANSYNFAVVCYNSDGIPDNSFGTNGVVITDIGSRNDAAYDVKILNDEQIIVAGYADMGSPDRDFALVCYNFDGILDTDFGSDGIVTADFGSTSDYAYGVVIQSDNKIVIAGHSKQTLSNYDFALARYNTDGSLDTDFGDNGLVISGNLMSSQDQGQDLILVQNDGKFLVGGYSVQVGTNSDFALVRYNIDGSLDTEFGTNGSVTTDFGGDADIAHGIALQKDDKIILVGNSMQAGTRRDFALARYNTDGSLDTDFGDGGKVTTDFGPNNYDEAYDVVIQNTGEILVVGYTRPIGVLNDFALARYRADGSLDETFGVGGKVTTDIESRIDLAYSVEIVEINGEEKIIVAGGSGNDFALARYNTDGSLDTEFDDDGWVTSNFNNTSQCAYGLAIQENGQIVLAGYAYQYGTKDDFAVARYNPDGSIDNDFADNGFAITSLGANSDIAYGVAIHKDGKIIAAGKTRQDATSDDFGLVCYNPDGTLYTDFGSSGIVTTSFSSSYDVASAVVIQNDGKILVLGYSNQSGYDIALARYEGFGPSTGMISGTITVGALGLEGVNVSLLDEYGNDVEGFEPIYTDENGTYSFLEVPTGDYQVIIIVPLGYKVDTNQKSTTVTAGQESTVDFTLEEKVIVNDARGTGYWRHQFSVYVTGKGHPHESEADLATYINDIHEHYTIYFSFFEDVVDFESWLDVLSVNKKPTMEEKAKKELAALLFNLVSEKIGQYTVVTEDGRTVGDVITHVSNLLEDEIPDNDEKAKDIAESVNQQKTIAAGIVPVGDILYKWAIDSEHRLIDENMPTQFKLNQNYPNPFNMNTTIQFAVPESKNASLKIYTISGQLIRTLVNGTLDIGNYRIQWDGTSDSGTVLPSGIYFCQFSAGNFKEIKKLNLIK